MSPVVNKGSEMSSFCVKQGQGLKASAAYLYPDFPWVPPRIEFKKKIQQVLIQKEQITRKWISVDISDFFNSD